MALRLVLRAPEAKLALSRFGDFLPAILNDNALRYIENAVAGLKSSPAESSEVFSKLLRHCVLGGSEAKPFLRLPLLTPEYSQHLTGNLQGFAQEMAKSSAPAMQGMARELQGRWLSLAHALVVEILLAGIWYALGPGAARLPLVVLVQDMDASNVISTEVISVNESTVLSYWQGGAVHKSDAIRARLNKQHVVKTLQSLADDGSVVCYGNAQYELAALRICSSGLDSMGNPITRLTATTIDVAALKRLRGELQALAGVFAAHKASWQNIVIEAYAQRPALMAHVDLADFSLLMYLVFSYTMVREWVDARLLPPLSHYDGASGENPVGMRLMKMNFSPSVLRLREGGAE